MKKVVVLLLLFVLAAQVLPFTHFFEKESIAIAVGDEDSTACEKFDLKKDQKEYFCNACTFEASIIKSVTYISLHDVDVTSITLPSHTPPPDACV